MCRYRNPAIATYLSNNLNIGKYSFRHNFVRVTNTHVRLSLVFNWLLNKTFYADEKNIQVTVKTTDSSDWRRHHDGSHKQSIGFPVGKNFCYSPEIPALDLVFPITKLPWIHQTSDDSTKHLSYRVWRNAQLLLLGKVGAVWHMCLRTQTQTQLPHFRRRRDRCGCKICGENCCVFAQVYFGWTKESLPPLK